MLEYKVIGLLVTLLLSTPLLVDQAFTQYSTGTLELNPIIHKVSEGDTIIFSGHLTTGSGQSVTDAIIYIKDDVDFAPDDIILTLVTDDNGMFYGTWIAKTRSSGAYDFYAAHEGSQYTSYSRSTTYSVRVSQNSLDYLNSNTYQHTNIILDKIPTSIYAGQQITFTGKLTSNGYPLSNKLVKIMEDDPFLPDQRIGYARTDSNGNYEVVWNVQAGQIEIDFDVYAVYDGDLSYSRARSSNQEMSVLKHTGSLVLDKFPTSVNVGDVVTFTGKLDLSGHSTLGAVVYIKDEDMLNPDDLLATAYVDEYGKFSVNWIAINVDEDNIADIYAVFEGSYTLYRLTSCDDGPTMDFGGACLNTRPLYIFGHLPTPPSNYIPTGNEYMELYYALDFTHTPHVAIVPSPDSYADVKKHIIPVQEGIRMWSSSLEDKFGGDWHVSFEVLSPGKTHFVQKPDVIVNLVSHDDHVECIDEYYGVAFIRNSKPVQTYVCSTSNGYSRTNADVRATAAHEFIHAVGLGHTFNKAGDLMCSVEDGAPTCDGLFYKLKTPSDLNLEAVAKIYGKDGFTNPNNNVLYKSKFSMNGGNLDDQPTSTTLNKCDGTYRYDNVINNERLNSGWFTWWTLCTSDPINYYFTTDNSNGFMIFVLPPATDVEDFMKHRYGKYYTCEDYEKKWISKSGTCNIEPGASIVIYNDNYDSIWLDGYIRN